MTEEIVEKPKGKMKRLFTNMKEAIANSTLIRRADFISQMFDPRRDIDKECGYPKDITIEQYRGLYDREGAGKRVVEFWPDESWTLRPNVFETEDPEETEFEKAWKELETAKHIFFHLHRIDVLSGIGRFGVLLLGLDDGKPLNEPVDGINPDTGEASIGSRAERKLLYLRAFDESFATVELRENDESKERFGQPVMYSLTLSEMGAATGTTQALTQRSLKVHWTRVIHIADNRETSEIFGIPRMQTPYNRVYDLRKILSGSGEMFWKGAFPGYALESNPQVGPNDLDTVSLREQLANHFNGLQRYIALAGMTIKSLAPQVSDPTEHIEVQMKNIAFTLGVPWRKFIGSEQAQLASEQDTRTWNGRVKRRNDIYLSPMVIRPTLDRLILIGILPEAEYKVEWPDLNTVTDEEKAKVAKERTEGFAKYVTSGADQLVPPEEYLSLIHGFNPEEVKQIMEAAKTFLAEVDENDLDDPDDPDLDNV